MQKKLLTTLILSSLMTLPNLAQANNETEARIAALEEQIAAMAEIIDAKQSSTPTANKTTIGGYGEIKYHHETVLNQDGSEATREIDLTRFVLFFGHQFSDRIRLESEFEVEHVLASAGSRGAVELEQAFLEFDLAPQHILRTGMMLMPIGIISETHEPPTFYGVDRPVIEKTIIPTTWWSTGVQWVFQSDSGIQTDVFIHEGLKTEDPNADTQAEPFNLKAGKQKSSFATAYDLATTVRIKYTGTPGLEVAAYAQYQPDLDQSAAASYAEDAYLLGGHVIYQLKGLKLIGLYSAWQVNGKAAKAAGKDQQTGGYLEASYQFNANWGAFGRHSAWSQQKDEDNTQQNMGVSYWPHPDVVFKFDLQQRTSNTDADDLDGFNLGMGYQF